MTNLYEVDADNAMWLALADPTRRAVFEIVAHKRSGVQEIADQLPVSRSAVSQHLKLLYDAGLVQAEKVGRNRYYAAQPEELRKLRDWLDRYWLEAMLGFADAADWDEDQQDD
mgnify:CR=1 FL=1